MLETKAYVFDLDDTLYCEHDYVRSGFWAVAHVLAELASSDVKYIYDMLVHEWKMNGRGKVFDTVCERLCIQANIPSLVCTYRYHKPSISLYQDAKKLLFHLRQLNKKIGIITDGHSMMQWMKIRALQLERLVDCIVVTGDLGDEHWKPSETPYRKMAECLHVSFHECMYIGDNPHKDFITAKKLGMKTVRIVREIGDHMQTKLSSSYEAEQTIFSLEELMKQ